MTGPRIGSIIKYKSWMEKTYFFVISSEPNEDVDYPDSYEVRLFDIGRGKITKLSALPMPYSDYAKGTMSIQNTLAWDYVDY